MCDLGVIVNYCKKSSVETYQDYINWLGAIHMGFLRFTDLVDQSIQSLCHHLRTPISPNIPIHTLIQSSLPPQRPDFGRSQAFIDAIIPFRYIFCQSYLFCVQARVAASGEKKLKRLLCPFTRTNPDFCNPGWIDQFSRPNKLASCTSNLLYTVRRKIQLGDSGVSAILGPFGFSCSFPDYIPGAK